MIRGFSICGGRIEQLITSQELEGYTELKEPIGCNSLSDSPDAVITIQLEKRTFLRKAKAIQANHCQGCAKYSGPF
jgi:hypothetical protein